MINFDNGEKVLPQDWTLLRSLVVYAPILCVGYKLFRKELKSKENGQYRKRWNDLTSVETKYCCTRYHDYIRWLKKIQTRFLMKYSDLFADEFMRVWIDYRIVTNNYCLVCGREFPMKINTWLLSDCCCCCYHRCFLKNIFGRSRGTCLRPHSVRMINLPQVRFFLQQFHIYIYLLSVLHFEYSFRRSFWRFCTYDTYASPWE